MYFLLIAIIALFSLLTVYAVIKTLWIFAIVFGVTALVFLVITIRRYAKNNKSKGDGILWDCLYFVDCPTIPSSSSRKGDCDCFDCDGPDCSV